MLVLTRKPGQAITIGDSVEVYVVDVRGDQVRLGIRAPRDISVLRSEIVDQVRQANNDAAALVPDMLQQLTTIIPASQLPPASSVGKKALKLSTISVEKSK